MDRLDHAHALRTQILKYITDHPSSTMDEITAAMSHVPRETVRKAVITMRKMLVVSMVRGPANIGRYRVTGLPLPDTASVRDRLRTSKPLPTELAEAKRAMAEAIKAKREAERAAKKAQAAADKAADRLRKIKAGADADEYAPARPPDKPGRITYRCGDNPDISTHWGSRGQGCARTKATVNCNIDW